MIADAALAPLLNEAAEGEVIVAGGLLKGLSDDEIAWVVIENVPMGNYRRVTLHAYWRDVFVVSKVAKVNGDKIAWGATGGGK